MKSTTARGYGHAHQQLRKQLEPLVQTGKMRCARCYLPILPGQPWDLGHDDEDRSKYKGPEHQKCNRATATKPVKVEPPRRLSREW